MREQMHPADQICHIMARIYENKLTTVSGGNLSLRDDEGNIWVTPSGGDKAALKRAEVCQILDNGETAGKAQPSLEFKIHKGILDKRPDLKAVLHAHSPGLVAMSIMHRIPGARILPDVYALTGEIKIAAYGLPGSEELVRNVSQVFEEGCDTVILENHGIFIGSRKDLFHAYKVFETLEFLSRIEMTAAVLNGGFATVLSDAQLERYARFMDRYYSDTLEEPRTNEETLLREQVCAMIGRAYGKQLFNSTQGVFSARLGAGDLIITPKGKDNAYLDKEDLVKVKGGHCEKGKAPHPLADLHQRIYDSSPEIQSVVCSVSPYAGTFVATGEPYDVRLIPECFNRLQSCKTFPFDALIRHPQDIASYLTLETPVAIIENAFYVIASVSPFAAYDRMEIFEYTARSIHYSRTMQGKVVNITEEQIGALKNRFKIPKPEKVTL